MTLSDIKTIIDYYLVKDQPSINQAVSELRTWLRDRQLNGEVHSFLVRSKVNGVILDVQTTPTSSTHTLQFDEAKWMNSTLSSNAAKTQVNLVPSRKNVTRSKKEESPADAYDRAMRGV